MSEELKAEELVPVPIEEQISQELVRQNVTEAIIADLKARLLPLKIAGIDDKETFLIVQAGRKECKALRVAAKKICTNGREQAVAISKAWIAKEKEVTGRISVVEDYLEKQEVEYEAEVAKEREARKRKQEDQLIMRQQVLSGMGVLYSDGNFSIGEVSFEFSLIKESEDDIWEETILPKFKEEYEKTQAEQIEKDRLKTEREVELKRQQEELEQKQKELAEKEADLKRESDRQADEARKAREAREFARTDQLLALGLKFDFIDHFKGYDCFVPILDLRFHNDEKWSKLIEEVTAQVDRRKAEEAEEERKKQERKDLQSKRLNELLPFNKYGAEVDMATLGWLEEDVYNCVLAKMKRKFEEEQDKERQRIADDASKKERERIEEEQRQAEAKRIAALGEVRMKILNQYTDKSEATIEGLGKMDDLDFEIIRSGWQDVYDKEQREKEEVIRKQEEERKAEELAQASEKVKWASLVTQINYLQIPEFKSGQYRKKAAILREKIEEIKAL